MADAELTRPVKHPLRHISPQTVSVGDLQALEPGEPPVSVLNNCDMQGDASALQAQEPLVERLKRCPQRQSGVTSIIMPLFG